METWAQEEFSKWRASVRFNSASEQVDDETLRVAFNAGFRVAFACAQDLIVRKARALICEPEASDGN